MKNEEQDPFAEFGGKEIVKTKPSSAVKYNDETDPFAEFGGKTLKKKDLSQGSKNTSTVFTKPSQPSQANTASSDLFGGKPQNEFIGKEREQQVFNQLNKDNPYKNLTTNKTSVKDSFREHQEQFVRDEISNPYQQNIIDTGKRVDKLERKGTDAMNSLSVGVNKLYAGIANLPRFIYEVPESILNILADAVENNAGKEAGDILRPTDQGNYDAFLKEVDKYVVGGVSPLTLIDKAGTYFENSATDYEKKAVKYDKDIVNSLGSGNFYDAGAQVVNNIVGSVPSMLQMYMTSGMGTALKLPSLASTTLSALPFASSKANEIRDNKDISKSLKPLYSLVNGYTEVIFDQSFGTQQILNKLTKTLTEQGQGEAFKIAKDVTNGYLNNAFEKVKEPLTDFMKNAIEEMSTQVSQNILDKLVVDPNKNLMDGVLDAGIVGGATGIAFSSVNSVLKSKQKQDINTKNAEIESLNKDLDNPNIPISTKEIIEQAISKKKAEIHNEIDKSKEEFSLLTEEQKDRSLEISAKMNDIEVVIEQGGISETSATSLTEQLKNLDIELGNIKPIVETTPVANEDKVADVVTKTTLADITPIEEVVSTETVKPIENDKLPTNNTQSQVQGEIQPVKDEVVPIKVEDAKTTPIPKVEEIDGDVTDAEKMQFGSGYKDYNFKKENVPTSRIKITEQPSLSERKDLIEDIKVNGIKEPIVVEYDKETDSYYVKNGNHRAAIAKELGIKEVPTIIAEYKEQPIPTQEVKGSIQQATDKSNLDLEFIADDNIPKETVDAYNKKGKLAGTTQVPNEKILSKQNEIRTNLETLKKFTKCLTA